MDSGAENVKSGALVRSVQMSGAQIDGTLLGRCMMTGDTNIMTSKRMSSYLVWEHLVDGRVLQVI